MLKNSSLRKNFTDLRYLTARHIKLYFKDKQTFFMSLITPLILVVLFALMPMFWSTYPVELNTVMSACYGVFERPARRGGAAR